MMPKEATIAITYRCNCRCSMCGIWQIKDHDELPVSEYGKLPRSLRTINVTGGEPFLREDIVEVVKKIHDVSPTSRIVISSNGLLTERITRSMSEMLAFHKKLGIGISIDGINEVHEGIRGVRGIFEKAIATLNAVKSLGITDVRAAMTITPANAHQVMDVFRLSNEMGVEFASTFAHNSDVYFKSSDNQPIEHTEKLKCDLEAIKRQHLRSMSVKSWFRAYHMAGVEDPSIRKVGSGRCEAASRFFFMDPKGDVFPCIVLDKVMGNIRDFGSFDDLWKSDKAREARSAVEKCKIDCWMACNVRSLFIRHPGPPVFWIAKNKPRAHMRPRSR